jgi:recombinational DNA repair protein (RecF pathway)
VSYKTYTTEAFVCGSYLSQTSDKSYLLFTQEAGMLYATAKSVREEKSKQRYALQDFSHVRVTLVKGKSGWKVGSAQALGNLFTSARSRSERALVHHVFRELRTYVHGEVPLTQTFLDLCEVCEQSLFESGMQDAIGDIFALRLFFVLGYINPHEMLVPLVTAHTLKDAVGHYRDAYKGVLMEALETAQKASHLA